MHDHHQRLSLSAGGAFAPLSLAARVCARGFLAYKDVFFLEKNDAGSILNGAVFIVTLCLGALFALGGALELYPVILVTTHGQWPALAAEYASLYPDTLASATSFALFYAFTIFCALCSLVYGVLMIVSVRRPLYKAVVAGGALMLLLTAVLYFDTAAKLYTQQVDFPLRSVAYYAAAIAGGAYQWRRSAPSRAKPAK